MRYFAAWFVVAALVLSGTASAQVKRADFSGKWLVNEGKSQAGEGRGRFGMARTLNVVQDTAKIVIERISTGRDGEERKTSETLTLDGKECENTLFNRTRKSNAVFSEDGKLLTISSSSVWERDGEKMEMKGTEIWKLSDDGDVLTLDAASTSPMGERKAVYVYDREKPAPSAP
jgi:hypothetical protein